MRSHIHFKPVLSQISGRKSRSPSYWTAKRQGLQYQACYSLQTLKRDDVQDRAPDPVDKFVLSAMPRARLQHAAHAPAAAPVRPNTCYFTFENKD
jgi:hypothetical protein